MIRAAPPRALGAVLLLLGVALAGCGSEAAGPAERGAGESLGADTHEHVSEDAPAGALASGVVLFVVDTLRADRFAVDGYPRATTPAIDALATRGTRYTRNYAQGGWTVPSMLSMMTGLYLSQESEAMPERQPALAELLSEAGVETAAFVGNQILTRTRGFERGFDHIERAHGKQGRNTARATRTSDWVERFADWHAARREPERPWFAWIHVFDPHAPYDPSERFDRFRRQRTPLESQVLQPRWLQAQSTVRALGGGEVERTVEEATLAMLRDIAGYDSEVLETDAGLGELVEYLDARFGGDAFDDVLLVVASDHGEMLYEYPKYRAMIEHTLKREGTLPKGLADYFAQGHTGFLYDEVWRTPLVLAGPGVEAGHVDAELSENVDVAPTVLAALGVDHDGLLQGRSKFASAPARTAVFGISGTMTSVRTADGRQLIEFPARFIGAGGIDDVAHQLFIDPRPGRAVDVAALRPTDVRELTALAATWRERAAFRTNDAVDTSGEQAILEELGYLDTGIEQPTGGATDGD